MAIIILKALISQKGPVPCQDREDNQRKAFRDRISLFSCGYYMLIPYNKKFRTLHRLSELLQPLWRQNSPCKEPSNQKRNQMLFSSHLYTMVFPVPKSLHNFFL